MLDNRSLVLSANFLDQTNGLQDRDGFQTNGEISEGGRDSNVLFHIPDASAGRRLEPSQIHSLVEDGSENTEYARRSASVLNSYAGDATYGMESELALDGVNHLESDSRNQEPPPGFNGTRKRTYTTTSAVDMDLTASLPMRESANTPFSAWRSSSNRSEESVWGYDTSMTG